MRIFDEKMVTINASEVECTLCAIFVAHAIAWWSQKGQKVFFEATSSMSDGRMLVIEFTAET